MGCFGPKTEKAWELTQPMTVPAGLTLSLKNKMKLMNNFMSSAAIYLIECSKCRKHKVVYNPHDKISHTGGSAARKSSTSNRMAEASLFKVSATVQISSPARTFKGGS